MSGTLARGAGPRWERLGGAAASGCLARRVAVTSRVRCSGGVPTSAEQALPYRPSRARSMALTSWRSRTLSGASFWAVRVVAVSHSDQREIRSPASHLSHLARTLAAFWSLCFFPCRTGAPRAHLGSMCHSIQACSSLRHTTDAAAWARH